MSLCSDISCLHFFPILGIMYVQGMIIKETIGQKRAIQAGKKGTEGDRRMLNFDEELEKFQPSMDVEKVEDVVYNNNLTDVTDIVKELIQDAKGTL